MVYCLTGGSRSNSNQFNYIKHCATCLPVSPTPNLTTVELVNTENSRPESSSPRPNTLSSKLVLDVNSRDGRSS